MMRMTQQKHMTDFFFTVALFAVFVVSSLLVLLFGVDVYRSSTDRMERNFTSQTTLAYIASKTRHSDASGSLSLGELDGVPALILSKEEAGVTYETYIYGYEGTLRELMVERGHALSPESGAVITDIGALTFSQEDRLLRVALTGTDGSREELILSPRSQT
ncbi:DUF4860 domain-containing protein [Zongyangia hominis]|uniref:DUF4860 domain-containing protein n=1 Tax=Zongyangia hominis TaxID=2763677 RepID=A0A926ICH5_9FIRM|nr:DUF4860 domain-containing protein [Zongyangia hominis]MBC8571368.1 DUF4860 domain-containing protein [Zongyangia hominis]